MDKFDIVFLLSAAGFILTGIMGNNITVPLGYIYPFNVLLIIIKITLFTLIVLSLYFKMRIMNKTTKDSLIIFFSLIYIAIASFLMVNSVSSFVRMSTIVKNSRPLPEISKSAIEIKLNGLSEYDYLTKEDVYNIRKKYVSQSLFASENYKPSDEVFGQIIDKKPWYGIDNMVCFDDKTDKKRRLDGLSEESRYVNNPNLLVFPVLTMSYRNDANSDFCKNDVLKLMPIEMFYSKDKSEIIAVYKADSGLRKIDNLQLSGLNARDFGYKYGYINKSQNIKMLNDDNAANNIYEFTDFIHLGNSCGVDGGCNNASPRQSQLEFKIGYLPAVIQMKLWKNKPLSKLSRADFTYTIRFELK